MKMNKVRFVVLTVALVSAPSVIYGVSWIRATARGVGTDARDWRPSFQLEVVRCDDDHLTGLAVLTRYPSNREVATHSVIVEGVETDDGRFWPTVNFGISDKDRDDWREIGMSGSKERKAYRQVDPQTPGQAFFIDLDIFRPFIDHARYGRFVLKNGEAAVFLMNDLRAPTESNDRKWARRADDLHPSHTDEPFLTRANEPILLFRLTEVAGNGSAIEGQFAYGSRTARPATDSEWVSFQDGNFWPSVTAEVANDDRGRWKGIGRSSNPDKPYQPKGPPGVVTLLRVDLTLFRPLIGTYRYGRVTLETGESAVFELVNLLPPGR